MHSSDIPLQIVGDFIFVKDDFDGKFYVIPRDVYPGFTISIFLGKFYLSGTNTSGTISLSFGSVLSKAKEYTKFTPTYIVRRGQFVDIKKTFEAAGIYIENDEMIPNAIMKRLSYTADKMDYLIDDRRVNGYFEHNIPAEKWFAPVKEYIICRGDGNDNYNILINGKKYYECDINRKLQDKKLVDGGSLIVHGNVIRSSKNEKTFSGGFIEKLMDGILTVDEFTEEIKKRHFSHSEKIDNKHDNTISPTKTDVFESIKPEDILKIVAYSRNGNKSFMVFSDFSMRFDSNDSDSDTEKYVMPSVCDNIIMYLTNEHIVVNCSGKFRRIKFSEIHLNIPNDDGSISLVLGDGEKITEVITIRHAYMDLERGQIINNAICDRSYPMIRG